MKTATATPRPGFLSTIGSKLGLHPAGELSYQPPLPPRETYALLDERARASLGMSADSFVRALRAGELPDTSLVRSLAILVSEDAAGFTPTG